MANKLYLVEKYNGDPNKEVKIYGEYGVNEITDGFRFEKSELGHNKLGNYFKNIFLPKGYPNSVSNDYKNYQIWDTLQAFFSTITGILATQEVFRGVGVGDVMSSALAATITWVTKDGCGHFGRILFAYLAGSQLDMNSKRWRLYADILNDVAMCLELNLSFMKDYVTPILCVSSVMKAVVGVAGSATRTVMTQHHAMRSNLADVTAKDSAQETAVNLFASLFAVLIITYCHNSYFLNIIFATSVFMHIFCNYKAVKVTCLNTYNETRLLIQLDYILRRATSLSVEMLNAKEPIFYDNKLTAERMCGYKIVMGCAVSDHINRLNFTPFVNNTKFNGNYFIVSDYYEGVVHVYLKENAGAIDIIRGYCEAYLTALLVDEVNRKHIIHRYFPKVLCASAYLYEWDLSKHLLPVDDWRIHEHST